MTDHKQNPSGSLEDPDIGALYRATRTQEPAAELDVQILARARSAARRRRNRWLLPLSSAAVVMLGLTLTLQVMEQEPMLPSVEDHAVDEAVESSAAPQPQMNLTGKKEKRAQRGQVEPGASTPLQREDAGLRLRKMAPAEEPASPAATGRAAVPQGIRVLTEEAPPATQAGDMVERPPVMESGAWLAHIGEMVAGGEIDEAIAELQRFRARYPDYVIPEVLQQLKRPGVERSPGDQ